MLPHMSGLEVCRRLKPRGETKSIPIIILSARSEELDRVYGLETGTDNYVVKPYSTSELIAWIKVQLWRTHAAGLGEQLIFEDIRLDGETHKVYRANNEVQLSLTEFHLLRTDFFQALRA